MCIYKIHECQGYCDYAIFFLFQFASRSIQICKKIQIAPEDYDGLLLRIDFVREVDALLREFCSEQEEAEAAEGFDADCK
ncbi:hypothetical protein MKX03_004183 [Papaver bracteatum]|nr:hypothetical protein MKX03_004183 [Papaver bracteatum]